MNTRTRAKPVPKPPTDSAPIPHSWDLEHWPAAVYPHDTSRARYLLRAYRDELTLAGALTRIGRELVILGRGYQAWLEKRRGEVSVPSTLYGAAAASHEKRERAGEAA